MIIERTDWVYTCGEVAKAFGVHPATIASAANKVLGRYPNGSRKYTLDDVRKIKRYFETGTAEREKERLECLRRMVEGVARK